MTLNKAEIRICLKSSWWWRNCFGKLEHYRPNLVSFPSLVSVHQHYNCRLNFPKCIVLENLWLSNLSNKRPCSPYSCPFFLYVYLSTFLRVYIQYTHLTKSKRTLISPDNSVLRPNCYFKFLRFIAQVNDNVQTDGLCFGVESKAEYIRTLTTANE